jgi:hypothetical protein
MGQFFAYVAVITVKEITMSHNATPKTSRVELRKTLTLIPVVMMGLAYMQPMTLFDTFGIVSGLTDGHVQRRTPLRWSPFSLPR